MSDEWKARKRKLVRLHLFSSKTKLKNKVEGGDSQNASPDNEFRFEKETLLKEKVVEKNCFKQPEEDKKHNFTESIKSARRTLLPQLLTSNRHRKFSRQSTIDIADIKAAVKEQQTHNFKPQMQSVKSSEDINQTSRVERNSLAHLDLAEPSQSHRRTATCEELEKFTVDQGNKSLYSLRRDLLTFQRLKEWSFL